MLQMHLQNLNLAKTTSIYALQEEWPPAFMSMSMRLEKPIRSMKSHQKALDDIPASFLSGYRMGKSIRHEEWYLTPLGPEGEEANWILLIATRQGDDRIYASSVW